MQARAKTKILCIDTEPEVSARLKEAGYTVFDVSMGYRTGKRGFHFPAPHEVNLIICDLLRPACFDRAKWGPGANDNFRCTILPYEQVSNRFTVVDGKRRPLHRVVYESQLGKQVPGTFGPLEVKRAIVEAGVPFLLFLNSEWLSHVEEFPNWVDMNWAFGWTTATQVEINEPLSSLVPEIGTALKFKLAIQHKIDKGPILSSHQAAPHPFSTISVVRNTVGDTFGQVVRMGKGSVWLIPATHQNVEVIELFAQRLNKVQEGFTSHVEGKRSPFTREERVRLYFLLTDLLPPPKPDSFGAETGGEELWSLQELLQRALGRMHIGLGDGIAAILHHFVMNASEDELLTMLELIPAARVAGIQKRASPFERFTTSDRTQMLEAINDFLDRIGSPARFSQRGQFTREGFADKTPASLKALPDRETLQLDVQTLEQDLLAIIYFDLDNFKKVNDTNGHLAGDRCLETVVSVAGGVVAHKGKLYRYGGDEFAILLRNFSAAEASVTAERLRTFIQKAKPGGNIAVTASVGVAATDIEGIDRSRLILAADAAMYVSKRAGRNQMTIWTSGTGYQPPPSPPDNTR